MSQRDARTKSLLRRPSRTIPASIVGVVLAAIGSITAAVAIVRLANGRWPNQVEAAGHAVARLTWGSAGVIVITTLVALVGLALIIAAIKPGRPAGARLHTPDGSAVGDTDYVISRRGIARLAAMQADSIDGVERLSTSANGRQVHLAVTTSSRQTEEIRARVTSAVTATLQDNGLEPVPRVTVTVRRR